MQRIFIQSNQLIADTITVPKDTHHHLFGVCKLTASSQLDVVVDGTRLLRCTITDITDASFNIRISDQWAINPTRPIPITLIQSLPKQDKLSEVCKQCTEVGVSTIVPVVSDYCNVTELSQNKLIRAKKIIQSASEQSKQHAPPTLETCQALNTYLTQHPTPPSTLALVAYENASCSLRDISIPTNLDHIAIAVGPEGGYSDKDISNFKDAGFTPFSLGQHILRTEHAGFAAINYVDGFLLSQTP
jgi:16S rRNA (uracil1498-N3)-methyltransferase